MKSRALCFIFILTLILSAFPFTALGAESYGICVSGTEITDENYADVFGNGTVSFDPEAETLTLNGAGITAQYLDDAYYGIFIEREKEVTINVTAESTVIGEENEGAILCGIYSKNNVKITGEMLKIVLKKSKMAYGVFSNGDVYFCNSTAYVDAANATDTGVGIFGETAAKFENVSARFFGTTQAAYTYGTFAIISGSYVFGNVDATETEPAYNYMITIPDTPDETPSDDDKPAPVNPDKDDLPDIDKEEEGIINTDTDKKDVSGSAFRPLMLRARAKGKTITLTWKKVSGADGYVIYGARCGKPLEKLKTVKSGKTLKHRFKNLKKGKYYKYVLVAYKNDKGVKRVITKSISVHCKTAGGKKGNPTGITVKSTKISIKKGKSKTLKPVLKYNKKVATHIAKFRYESSDSKTVKVNSNGKITAKKKGTAYVYVIAQNGIYKRIKITVK